MAEYSSLKVPDLKKLLTERSLPTTGNKADLIARLVANDDEKATAAASAPAAEDEIDYSDDEPVTEKIEEPALASVAEATTAAFEPAVAKPTESAAEITTESTAAAAEEPVAAAPTVDSAEEARKRADRAKRFGMDDEETRKRVERAARFGIDQNAVSNMLDQALPERQSRKRGRENADGQHHSNKRQSTDRRGGNNDRRNQHHRGNRRENNNNNNRNYNGNRNGGGQYRKSNILDDPAERAKAEARAKRFGTAA